MPLTPPPVGYAVVTGAASGIGRAIADQLAAGGWQVARVDLDDRADNSPPIICCDVSQPSDWIALEARLRERWPRIDLLVNSAGVLAVGDLIDSPVETITRVLDVNVKGVALGCRVLGPWLIESRGARPHGLNPRPGVINLSSVFAAIAPPGFATYNASKAAVLTLSESLHGELAPHGLNVTVVAPGVVRTPFLQRGWFATDAHRAAAERFYQHAELEPEQVARAALEAAGRGQMLSVVGGRARRAWLLKRLFPELVRRRIASHARRELRAPANRIPPQRESPPAGGGATRVA